MLRAGCASEPLRSDARQNRARVIEAAYAVFREQGLDAEMRAIAARAGVSVATLYRNFPTRDSLVAAMVDELTTEFETGLQEALETADPLAALRLVLRCQEELFDRFGVLALAMQGNPPAAARWHESAARRIALIISIIERGIATGVLRADLDPEIAANGLLGTGGLTMHRRLRERLTLDELAEARLDLFLRGAGPR
jgi:AcrR family transcriptional regulator